MLLARLGEPGGPLALHCFCAHHDDVEIGCAWPNLRLLGEHPGSTVHWHVFASDSVRRAQAFYTRKVVL